MSTHTVAKLKISRSAFEEIRRKLKKAGYGDCVIVDCYGALMNMNGLALTTGKPRRSKKASARQPLHEVNWLHLGTTKQYDALKKRLQHVVHDVVAAGCIDEIVINDIVRTFQQHGFIVVPEGKA